MWEITFDESENKSMDVRSSDFVAGQELPCKFRLFDDEDVCMFEGNASEDADFRPLDEFGEKYGCTVIKYLCEDGEAWEVL